MAGEFDPYHRWLGIPPAEQPPTHYRLLGLAEFESDPEVISGAADRQMAHVRHYQIGHHVKLSQQILNELAKAKLCLLAPAKKEQYDGQLRQERSDRRSPPPPPPPPPGPGFPAIDAPPVSSGHRGDDAWDSGSGEPGIAPWDSAGAASPAAAPRDAVIVPELQSAPARIKEKRREESAPAAAARPPGAAGSAAQSAPASRYPSARMALLTALAPVFCWRSLQSFSAAADRVRTRTAPGRRTRSPNWSPTPFCPTAPSEAPLAAARTGRVGVRRRHAGAVAAVGHGQQRGGVAGGPAAAFPCRRSPRPASVSLLRGLLEIIARKSEDRPRPTQTRVSNLLAFREAGNRKEMLAAYGGTQESERAVERALVWLARHQSQDGSWSLQDFAHQCNDPTCTDAGSVRANAGATALGLLPLLAAGHTHKYRSAYQGTVAGPQLAGPAPEGRRRPGLRLRPAMYAHGWRPSRLCEAYGTDGRPESRRGRSGVNFIERPEPQTGGWRYKPGEEGDLSVVGWQVMALKSTDGRPDGQWGHAGRGREVPQFLRPAPTAVNSVTNPRANPPHALNAVGLLCRQKLGIAHSQPHDGRRDERTLEPPARRGPTQHLLLVLRHAGRAQPRRHGLANVEPQGPAGPDRVAVQGREDVHQWQLAPAAALERRVGRQGRPIDADGPVGPDAERLLSLPPALSAAG